MPLLLAAQATARGAVLGLAGCGVDTPSSRPPDVATTATGIDVHCHVFNARDLPVPGFVLHVVLEKNPLADLQFGLLVSFLVLMIDAATIDPDLEVAALQDGTEQPFFRAQFAASGPPSLEEELYRRAREAALALQGPDQRSRAIMRRVQDLAPRNGPQFTAQSIAPDEAPAFLDRLARLTPNGPVPGTEGGTRDRARFRAERALPARLTPDQRADAAAKGVVEHARNRSGVFYLAALLMRPRNGLIRRLVALPADNDASGVALVTPALVDFSYWLDERANNPVDPDSTAPPPGVTPLAKQIGVMSAIAAIKANPAGKSRPYAVHPFVSFCPWRQLAEQTRLEPETSQQFALVRDAVRNRGFIGVKLYPVMGFLPFGNALAADKAEYPARLRRLRPDWAEQLDAVLAALYQWCVDEEVPLMAHCSFSQYPSRAAGRRGGPKGWQTVLDQPRWKTLRLNLAHCGGVWNLAPDHAAQITAEAGGAWPIEVIDMLGQPDYPNLYADLADFDGVLACPAALTPALAACDSTTVVPKDSSILPLARRVACNPAARLRLMYGTDYMFLIQAPGTRDYLTQMRDCLAPALGMNPDDLLGGNAARFLGLDNPASGTRIRLDRFRGDDFLARWSHPRGIVTAADRLP